MLIRNGAQLETKRHCGDTALIRARKLKHITALRKLIKAGADINMERNNCTLLSLILRDNQCAAVISFDDQCESLDQERKCNIIQDLLEIQARVANYELETAPLIIHNCIKKQHFDLLKILIMNAGFPPTTYKEATKFCYLSTSFLQRYPGIVTPFCMALVFGELTLAVSMKKFKYEPILHIGEVGEGPSESERKDLHVWDNHVKSGRAATGHEKTEPEAERFSISVPVVECLLHIKSQ